MKGLGRQNVVTTRYGGCYYDITYDIRRDFLRVMRFA
jgi:hypothetical protein